MTITLAAMPPTNKIDVWLDADHAVEFTTFWDESEPAGGILWHRAPQTRDGWCAGAFWFRQPKNHPQVPLWHLVSLHPLHLEPSFQCWCKQAHGFIHAGKWEAA